MSILKSLLSGQEVQLNDGAFGPLSEQILRLFTELKAIQSEQIATQGLDNIPIVNVFKDYFANKNIKLLNFLVQYRHYQMPLKKNLHSVFVVLAIMLLARADHNF